MKNNIYGNFVVIADDFTGANDTGVQFKKRGYNTIVFNKIFCEDYATDYGILVINTDTRLLESSLAKKLVYDISCKLKSNISKFYKKIDSTFRGNVGCEIESMLDALKINVCVILAAFPDAKRTTLDGVCFVDSVELAKTSFANDPITPVSSSVIKEILNIEGDYIITNIRIEDIHSKKFREIFLESINNNYKQIFICDSNTNNDILLIADIVYEYLDKILCVGSAGFANALSSKFPFMPICFVSGSVSPASLAQIEYFSKNDNISILDIDRDLLFSSLYDKLNESIKKQIDTALDNKNHILVTISGSNEDILLNSKYSKKYSIDEKLVSKFISKGISKIMSYILKEVKLRALFISGGDTAINLMEEINCDMVSILGEISTGVPYGVISNGAYKGLSISTKAGGFGEIDILSTVLNFYTN